MIEEIILRKKPKLKLKDILLLQNLKKEFYEQLFATCKEKIPQQYFQFFLKHILIKKVKKQNSVCVSQRVKKKVVHFTENDDLQAISPFEESENRKKFHLIDKIPKIKTIEIRNTKRNIVTATQKKKKHFKLRKKLALPQERKSCKVLNRQSQEIHQFLQKKIEKTSKRQRKQNKQNNTKGMFRQTIRNETLSYSFKNKAHISHTTARPLILQKNLFFSEFNFRD